MCLACFAVGGGGGGGEHTWLTEDLTAGGPMVRRSSETSDVEEHVR